MERTPSAWPDRWVKFHENSLADLIAIPASKTKDVHEAVLAHTGPVSASMIDGRWTILPATL